MMDFNYLGSSSNLSALAPPFTLDRTFPKPNSEPFLNFTDPPPAVPFSSSSLPTWQYSLSSASNPNCYSDSSADFGVDSIRTTYPGSESYFPYFGVPPISSPTPHMPPLNANVSTTPDAFGFPKYSGPIPTSYDEPKLRCHSFVSPVIENDVPLAGLPKPDYDLSSTSQIDYLQSLSGLKYTPQWGSYWDNIDSSAAGEMGKQVDYDGNFRSTQIDGSYAYRSYPDQGASTAEGLGIGKEYPSVRLNLLGGESQTVTPVASEVNSEPFPTHWSSFTRYDPERSVGISTFPKSHANEPLAEAAATILKHQMPYELQVQSFQPLNAGKSESVTTKRSSPPVVIRPPPVGFSLHLDKKEHSCDSFPSSIRDLSNKPLTENVEAHLSKAEKELQLHDMNAPPSSFTSASEAAATILNHQKPYESQDQSFQPLNTGKSESVTTKKSSPPVVIRPPPVGFSLRLDKKERFCDSFPSNMRGDPSNEPLTENVEEHLSKAQKELKLPDMNAPLYCFTSASDRVKSVSSVEDPLEGLDKYYPALDSPCWKGVSSFRFSPSEDHEPASPEHSVMKPGPLGALKLQQTQFCTPFGEDNAKNYSKKAPENGYVELGSLLCPDSLPNASSPVKVDDSIHDNGADHAKMSSSNLDPFSNKFEKLAEEFSSSNDTKICSDLKPVQWKKPDFENDLELGFGSVEAGLDNKSPSLKLDVLKLVETIHNLSKLLLFQCSEDASALSVVGQGSLNLAMKNLVACVSKMVPNPIEESSLQKSVISGRPPLPKEASSCTSFDNHRSEQGRKNSELTEKEVKKFTDLISARVDEDFEKDNKVTQGIKKIFEENFTSEEKMQSEALFFKNLWLEAEAALCSVSFRARFDRVKTEVDKYKLPKKIEEPVKTFEELYSEVFPNPSSPRKGNPIIEAFKMFHQSNQDPSASRTSEAVDEAGDSFKARLDILNSRVPNLNSAYTVEQTDEEVDAAFAETIKTVEKLLSSDDAEDCAMTNLMPKVPRQHFPSLSTSKTSDNVEASVMARLQILKDRGVSAISEKSGLQSEQEVSSEYSEQRNPWRFDAVLYEDDIVDGPLSQDCKVSEHEMVKAFHVRASDDLANQLDGNMNLGTQISSGWGDGSLSDWEDVLKDEFACQK